MLDISCCCTPKSIWPGIFSYAASHTGKYHTALTPPFTDDDLLKMLRKNAQKAFPQKEYDTFRKAITALRKGTAHSLKRENLYRLCYALELDSDAQAQDLFQNYLHQNELSLRSLDEFILTAALKLQLSWEDTSSLRNTYSAQTAAQPMAPTSMEEGHTAEVYYTVIQEKLHSRQDLACFLNHPENLSFFARTRNTQYLALFDDVKLDILYNSSQEQIINLLPFYGASQKETIQNYYLSLFGLAGDDSGDSLSMEEITLLSRKFEHVFMTYDNFCLLVQRKRPADISSGTFMLSLLKKLLTDESDADHDFYVDFLNPEEFTGICNDILVYFGFPILNPACDNFDCLLMDVYTETLNEHPDAGNTLFQELYLQNLRKYLRLIARA